MTYKDIDLAMMNQECIDWLLLQSIGFKNSAALTCGQMSGVDKVITSRGNQLLLHLHTTKVSRNVADNDEAKYENKDEIKDIPDDQITEARKGFKLSIQS